MRKFQLIVSPAFFTGHAIEALRPIRHELLMYGDLPIVLNVRLDCFAQIVDEQGLIHLRIEHSSWVSE